MKILLIILTLFLISSCGRTDKKGISLSGDQEFDRICIDNVEYIFAKDSISYRGYMAPHFKKDGTLYLCD